MVDIQVPWPLRRVYEVLAQSSNLAADSALVDALPKLTDSLRRSALEIIFDRGQDHGLNVLVAHFGAYDPALQSIVLEYVEHLHAAARRAIASEAQSARLSAIQFIRASDDVDLACLLSDALTCDCPRTKTAAAVALQGMALSYLQRQPPASDVHKLHRWAESGEPLGEALRRALECWHLHFRGEVLSAAMALSHFTEKALFEQTGPTRAHVYRALHEALHDCRTPEMVPCVLRALGHADLRPTAASVLSSWTDPPVVGALLQAAWLSRDPVIAQGFSRVRELPWLTDVVPERTGWNHEQWNAALRLLEISGIAADRKLLVYRRVLRSAPPAERETALWGLIQVPGVAGSELLREIAKHGDPPLAEIAARELLRRHPGEPVVAHHAAQRSGAAPAEPADELERHWARFDQQPGAEAERRTRELWERSATFQAFLAGRLRGADAEDRLRALRLVRLGGLAGEFEERVYALAHDADDRVRSAALSLLSELEGATAVRILRQALNDPNARVQANAVEVLEALGVGAAEPALTRKLESDDNRVRANAAKALLPHGVRDAAVTLLRMLTHESPAQRLSGLWVVQRLGLVSLLPRVRALANHDPDGRVRDRARAVVHELPAAPTPADAPATGARA